MWNSCFESQVPSIIRAYTHMNYLTTEYMGMEGDRHDRTCYTSYVRPNVKNRAKEN